MSRDNVELVRQRFEAFNRGDLATMVELTDPAAVWWDRADDPWGGAPHRGRDACMQHLAEILEDAELQAEPQEFIDADQSVVVGVRLVGRGRTSGATFEEHEFHVFTLRDGRVIETREYRDREEALDAVGRSEQTAQMSDVSIEVVRRAIWAFENDAEAFKSMQSSEGVWFPFEDNHSPSYGIEGAMRVRSQWLEAWSEYRSEIEDVVAERENVVVSMHATGQGKTSGVPVDVRCVTLRGDITALSV